MDNEATYYGMAKLVEARKALKKAKKEFKASSTYERAVIVQKAENKLKGLILNGNKIVTDDFDVEKHQEPFQPEKDTVVSLENIVKGNK